MGLATSVYSCKHLDGAWLLVRPDDHSACGAQVDGHVADLLGVAVAVLARNSGGNLTKVPQSEK